MPLSEVDVTDSLQFTLTTNNNKSVANLKCLWIISDFKQVTEKVKEGDWIDANQTIPVFPDIFSCMFSISLNGAKDSVIKNSGLFLKKTESSQNMNPWISFRFALEDCHGILHHDRSFEFHQMKSISWGFPHLLPFNFFKDDESTLLPNGCLQIYVEGTVSHEDYYVRNENSSFEVTNSMATASLFRTGEFSDITITVNETSFKVHKTVVLSRSKVLYDMLKNSPNNLVIDYVKPEDFREVLYFLYNDMTTAIMKTILPDVLKAAYRFEIERLKNVCVDVMVDNISADNVIGYFRVSSEVNSKELREKCMDFIVHNSQAITVLDSWKVFKEEHSDLGDLLEKMFISSSHVATL